MFGFRHQRLDVHFFFLKFLIVLFKVILEARSEGDRSGGGEITKNQRTCLAREYIIPSK